MNSYKLTDVLCNLCHCYMKESEFHLHGCSIYKGLLYVVHYLKFHRYILRYYQLKNDDAHDYIYVFLNVWIAKDCCKRSMECCADLTVTWRP